jgi:hypothetical protein
VRECKEITPKLLNTFSLWELEFKWNFETFEINFEKSIMFKSNDPCIKLKKVPMQATMGWVHIAI